MGNVISNPMPQSVGVKKKRWVVCFENTILDLNLPIYEKMVYIALCSHAKKDGPCYPSVKKIAEEASCSRTKVFEALKTLEEHGIIARDSRIFEGRGQTSNLYEIIDIVPRPRSEQEGDGNTPSPSAGRTEESATRTGGVRETDTHIKVLEQDYMNKIKEQNPPTPQGGTKSETKGETKREGVLENFENLQRPEPTHDTAGITTQRAESSKPDLEAKLSETELYELIRRTYNTVLSELPQAGKITASRASILRQRIAENPVREKPGWWKRFFMRVREFPWPMGNNASNWRADFDWLIGEKGMQKIIEGGFRRTSTSTSSFGEGTEAGLRLQEKHTDQEGRINARALL
ncbi:hypothetical protein AGMMS49957_00050 [Synergistales bacterium]|nr:hypothetical protein AGMMS49957_00050 [Synergistales bacterium]